MSGKILTVHCFSLELFVLLLVNEISIFGKVIILLAFYSPESLSPINSYSLNWNIYHSSMC